MISNQNQLLKRIQSATGVLLLMFVMELGCAHSVSDICSQDLERWNDMIDQAIHQLESGSELLSNPSSHKIQFEKWAEMQLKRVEKGMVRTFHGDARRRKLQNELTEIANFWVEFHGYAQLSQKRRMILTLQKILVRQKKVQSSFCMMP